MRQDGGWWRIHLALGVALVAMLGVSACVGALSFTPAEIGGYLAGLIDGRAPAPEDLLGRNVFLTLRLPRVILCGVTGAVLGLSGALMQGLFRNPIVEPGLAGTSAGAALGAAIVFVYGGSVTAFTAPLGTTAVPIVAFVGAFGATMLVYRLSTLFGLTDVLTLLLAGIAVNAVCNAGTGFLSYVARDPQARNITFWNFGTFTTADWSGTLLVLAVFLVCLVYTLAHAKSLNALMLGEENAAFLGLEPDRLIFRLLIVNTAMVAVATAMVGVISFVGLVVPHVLRLTRSSDYRFLVPGSALLGAVLMEMFDIVARIVIRPAELPIGIITALVGAPVFLWVLVGGRQRRRDAFV